MQKSITHCNNKKPFHTGIHSPPRRRNADNTFALKIINAKPNHSIKIQMIYQSIKNQMINQSTNQSGIHPPPRRPNSVKTFVLKITNAIPNHLIKNQMINQSIKNQSKINQLINQGYTLRPGDRTLIKLLPSFFSPGASMPSAVLCLWKVSYIT